MVLTDKQLQEVTDAIRDRHLAFVISVLGEDAVPAKDVERLRKKGFIGARATNLPRLAYEFGVLSRGLEDASAQNLSYQEFLKRMTDPSRAPLSIEERAAVKTVQRSMLTSIKGLGNIFDQKTQRVLIEADHSLRRRLESRIKREVVAGIEHRKTVREVAQALAKVSGDVERDWTRIASTEMHNAFTEGRAHSIQAAHKGEDPVVFKRPRPDACPKCKQHYLEADGVTPKVFALSELVANGTTNEGRKLSQWRPTLGCLHPFCQCPLHELPAGFGFDASGRMVFTGT